VVIAQRWKHFQSKMLEFDLQAVLVTHRPNIHYLSGFTGTSGFLLITPEKVFLFTDFRYLEQAQNQSPSFEVVKIEGGMNYQKAVNVLTKEGISSLAVEEDYLSVKAYKQLKKAGEWLTFTSADNLIEKLRATKEKKEIDNISRAAQIADQAFKEVLPLLRPGIRELDFACELEYSLRKNGSEGIPFEIIVASGHRSALPHGVASQKAIGDNELVTVDFGAVCGGYCSDTTRTMVVGKPDQKQKQIFELVLQAQELAQENLESGIEVVRVDAQVRSFFQQHGFGDNFGHGLGHGIGLEVHERPSLSPRGQGTLEEGMVFTVEPGLYFRGWGGVRIEDLIVLRASGPESLTKSPKVLELN